MSTKKDSTCLKKAHDDETVFVLRAQDVTAPHAILFWIGQNFETCPDEKLREAFDTALKMKEWHVRKNAD